MLQHRGWTPVETDPSNCVRSAWKKSAGSFTAEIKIYDGEVKGYITAASQKVQGTITFEKLRSLQEAADVLEPMLAVLSMETQQALPVPTRRTSDIAVPA
jgi:hypothetical protein